MNDNQQLKNVGLKITSPRLKILQILHKSTQHHLSAEQVYKIMRDKGEEIGLATIYRVLMQFEATGLVQRHNFEGGAAVYELYYNTHHDHLVCSSCGLVDEFIDACIEERQQAISKQQRFTMTSHTLVIYGICFSCSKKHTPE